MGDVHFLPDFLLWSSEIFSIGGSLWCFQVWILQKFWRVASIKTCLSETRASACCWCLAWVNPCLGFPRSLGECVTPVRVSPETKEVKTQVTSYRNLVFIKVPSAAHSTSATSLPWLLQNYLYNHDFVISFSGQKPGQSSRPFLLVAQCSESSWDFPAVSVSPTAFFLVFYFQTIDTAFCVCTTSVELCVWRRGGVFLCMHIHTHTYPDLNYASGRIYSPLWAQLIS